ncbi:arginine--tRNA ligase [Calycomorphotria hydatis]|uniref:Arginine--tRNA ligase n=1 Tax=Calycomorphotria hydatis TaxID=2528027 RepID=A0A517T865_9PLAN|nr:arginine--tRNA ligase [Calycomorphotria hydatis]QDT64563.1 Arginine--tRNA ligase [Calycomorphotria hydatis]
MDFLAELKTRFDEALQPYAEDREQYLGMIKVSQDAKFGDFQANFAMPLAKVAGQKPRDIAAEIIERVDLSGLCEPPEVAGPGFINLRISDDRLQSETAKLIEDDRVGVAATESPRKIVVDFSAPNVAKPMHVGHLRSTVIGESICRVLRFLGHNVIGDNHIGDWGTQFGMIIYGYKNFLNHQAFEEEPVAELARLYRLVNQLSDYHATKAKLPGLKTRLVEQEQTLAESEANADANDKAARKKLGKMKSDLGALREEIQSAEAKLAHVENSEELAPLAAAHPNIAENARGETAKLHVGDPENQKLWEQFLPACLEALNRVYERLGVHFDEMLGESYFQPLLAEVVKDLEQKGLAEESDGAVVIFSDEHAAPFIIRKKDGAFLYATTDLATIKYRVEEWSADEILYVVDKRQSQHFEQLFDAAKRWGYDNVEFRHINFGTILGEDRRPFKTRSGDTVGLESLIDEAVVRSRQIVDENEEAKPDDLKIPVDERDRIAEIVGIGGIKYADLKHNRDSDYVFSWDKMLAMNGDTATYMQYAYARVCGILRKGGISIDELRSSSADLVLEHPHERALALQLNRFSEAITGVVRDYRPNVLTDYLFETAGRFSSFYDSCSVLKAESEELRRSRLLLCDLTARVMRQGLELLGIETSDRM